MKKYLLVMYNNKPLNITQHPTHPKKEKTNLAAVLILFGEGLKGAVCFEPPRQP